MAELPRRNPFRPGVGTVPLHLAGRDAPIRRFRSMLRAAPEQPANMRLTGLRGVGKTVLLREFEMLATTADGWAAARLELQPGYGMEDALVTALTLATERTRHQLSRAERVKAAVGDAIREVGTLGVSWNDVTLTYTPGRENGREEDLARALFDVVEMSVEKGRRGFILLLDEAQVIRDARDASGDHPLSLLIASVVSLQQSELPLGLVLCGLPTLTGNLLRARSYTERMFRGEEIGSLDPDDARAAFTEPLAEVGEVFADEDLVEAVVDEVEGYPYFIQLWGAELWDAADIAGSDALTQDLLDVVRPDIYSRLDIDFYEPRVATLTPAEQDVLLATAACPYPPLVVADLNDAVPKTAANINVLLGRLVESGVLYRIRKGQYEYTAPKFRDYLLRRVTKHDATA